MKRIPVRVLLGLLGASHVVSALAAAEAPAALEPAPMNFGLTRSTFANVNPTDAEAVFRVFAQSIGRQRGYALATRTQIFDTPAACEKGIKKGDLSMVILDALEYLAMDIPMMEPAFVHLVQGVVLKEQLLLVRQGSGLQALADLRGRDIVVLSSRSGSVATTWLEVTLFEAGLGGSANFFRKVDLATKASATVLPVFFGTKAACVVDRVSFQTMVELNPQVGQLLVPLAVSEPILDSVTCILRSYANPVHREDLVSSLRELHLEPAGRQILNLFRVDQLVPFQEEHLAPVRKLQAQHARLTFAGPAAAGPGPLPAKPISNQ